jgi:hypothetical protein
MPWLVYERFEKVSASYQKWAEEYITSCRAVSFGSDCSPDTEWPVFGSAYYLLTAEEIVKKLEKKEDAGSQRIVRTAKETSKIAAEVLANPNTGNWTRNLWGDSYREKENNFYRMLIIMGLSSYEKITNDNTYRELLKEQSFGLASELKKSNTHLLDDYPGECYPSDVLWAVAAIIRSDDLLGTDNSQLKKDLISSLNKNSLTKEGLPAYSVFAETGAPIIQARGCSNSGILIFAPELDRSVSRNWYKRYESHFLKDNGFCLGFREFKSDYQDPRADMDTGVILKDYGSVATAFAIGAARANGRLDHSVPLTMEMVAVSWPTPFGFLVPKFLSYANCRISCMGEIALLFLMSRPIVSDQVRLYEGHMPLMVSFLISAYLLIGFGLIFREAIYWQKRFKEKDK